MLDESLAAANEAHGHELVFFEAGLEAKTTPLAQGFPAVCLFVNDEANAEVVQVLAAGGTKLLALRSAGFNHVDLEECKKRRLNESEEKNDEKNDEKDDEKDEEK